MTPPPDKIAVPVRSRDASSSGSATVAQGSRLAELTEHLDRTAGAITPEQRAGAERIAKAHTSSFDVDEVEAEIRADEALLNA